MNIDLSNILNGIIILILLILTVGFLFYKKIIHASLLFIKLMFPICLVMALITLLVPQVYVSFVENKFTDTVLAKDLRSVDSTLTQVSRVQISISNTLNRFLNTGNQESLEEYKSNIYKQVVDFMAGILRIFILTIAIIVLFVALYLRYSFSGSFEVESLQKQINNLKKEVELLKSKENL